MISKGADNFDSGYNKNITTIKMMIGTKDYIMHVRVAACILLIEKGATQFINGLYFAYRRQM